LDKINKFKEKIKEAASIYNIEEKSISFPKEIDMLTTESKKITKLVVSFEYCYYCECGTMFYSFLGDSCREYYCPKCQPNYYKDYYKRR
jgi:hypothetical protein